LAEKQLLNGAVCLEKKQLDLAIIAFGKALDIYKEICDTKVKLERLEMLARVFLS